MDYIRGLLLKWEVNRTVNSIRRAPDKDELKKARNYATDILVYDDLIAKGVSWRYYFSLEKLDRYFDAAREMILKKINSGMYWNKWEQLRDRLRDILIEKGYREVSEIITLQEYILSGQGNTNFISIVDQYKPFGLETGKLTLAEVRTARRLAGCIKGSDKYYEINHNGSQIKEFSIKLEDLDHEGRTIQDPSPMWFAYYNKSYDQYRYKPDFPWPRRKHEL